MRTQIFSLITVTMTVCFLPMLTQAQNGMDRQQLFQLRIYHLDNTGQEEMVDNYLESAYLPALHRAGIGPVGVFKPLEQDENASDFHTYLLIPFDSFEEMHTLYDVLQNDQRYLSDGGDYLEATEESAPYSHFEDILMEAFPFAPTISEPDLDGPRSDRVYELRSYGSPTEALNVNKVEMFNQGGELAIFARLDFNAVFYGNVIAGSDMPNLMYLTSYENMESRDEHWDAFFSSPEWEELSGMEKYDGNVSRVVSQFLQSTSYSDL